MTEESPERRDPRRAILSQIDAGDDPARIGPVTERAIMRNGHDPSAVFEAFATLFRSGEVYEPKAGFVRRTAGGDE